MKNVVMIVAANKFLTQVARKQAGSHGVGHMCLSCLGKTEVNRGRRRIGPARRNDLSSGVEVDAFGAVHVAVPEEGSLPTAERVVRNRHGNRNIDAEHADLDLHLELTSCATVTGEDRSPVGELIAVDQRNGIVE